MRRDEATLLDMMLAADDLAGFIAGMSEDEFFSNQLVQSASEHCLSIIGEAAKRLSPSFRDAHDDIPSNGLSGLREKLVHSHDRIDVVEVWRIASVDVPRLREWLEPRVPRRPD